jgi:hypothetical protein
VNLVATWLLLAAPEQVHRFVHLLGEAPVGEIELRRNDEGYAYRSRHYFRRGKISEERFESAAATVWASESLLRPRPVGCWAVEDELSHRRGEACVVRSAGSEVSGTLLGDAFAARYEHGLLQQLQLGESKFVRTESAVEFKDPFGEGFSIKGQGASLSLVPRLKGARSARVSPGGSNEDCLAAAQGWLAEHPDGWELVLGLLEDEGRGWPHAWVRHRASGKEVDPSRPLAGARYLALPSAVAGAVYVELLGKRRSLVRVWAE